MHVRPGVGSTACKTTQVTRALGELHDRLPTEIVALRILRTAGGGYAWGDNADAGDCGTGDVCEHGQVMSKHKAISLRGLPNAFSAFSRKLNILSAR